MLAEGGINHFRLYVASRDGHEAHEALCVSHVMQHPRCRTAPSPWLPGLLTSHCMLPGPFFSGSAPIPTGAQPTRPSLHRQLASPWLHREKPRPTFSPERLAASSGRAKPAELFLGLEHHCQGIRASAVCNSQ